MYLCITKIPLWYDRFVRTWRNKSLEGHDNMYAFDINTETLETPFIS